jgi:murein DD-endopeptidase MepM/ murein hydrolase activator NlpD
LELTSWKKGLLIILLLALVGCQQTSDPSQNDPIPTATVTNTLLPAKILSTMEPQSSVTEVLVLSDLPENDLPLDADDLSTPVPDPLRFVFPTAQVAPVSAWRPPLYPTPWALSPYDHFYFSRPIAADQINWPSQDYRYGGEFFQNVVHTGVDIPAPKGTPVLAAGSGKIIWAGYGVYRGGFDTTDPYGLAVTIRHDFGYQGLSLYSIYGHLDEIVVVEGQQVQTGDILGEVGETGRVTGPHLHFEVRIGENSFFGTRNPELWIVPPVGWGVLAGQVLDSNGQPVDAQPLIITSTATGQNWFARSYMMGSPINPDPYYQENLVVGDLPEGSYLIRLSYAGRNYTEEVQIKPGQVSYFYFYGRAGIVIAPPPSEELFTLPDASTGP